MSNEFFARWSRRKLDEASPEPDEAAVALPDAGETPAPVIGEVETSDDVITAEELAALPDPDAVTTWADITGFLRQGVPLALRNRALRRIWSLDPSIRDYIGDARDYAWDWNTPGGMPVSGPLSATTDVGKIVRGLYEPAPEAPIREAEPHAGRDDMTEPAPNRKTGEPPTALPEPDAPASPRDSPDVGDELPMVRATRHGGALPS